MFFIAGFYFILVIRTQVLSFTCSTPNDWLKDAYHHNFSSHHKHAISPINILRGQLWPGGVVKYHIHPSLTFSDKVKVSQAFMEFKSKTCIRFKPREPNDTDYTSIEIDNNVCGLGHVCKRGGYQFAKFGGICRTKFAMIHELGHNLCLGHEHQRGDRDDYIYYQRYCKRSRKFFGQQKGFYDYASVMHYECGDCLGGKPKIESVKKCGSEVQSGLSVLDADHINELYDCQGCFRHRWIPAESIGNADRENLYNFGYVDFDHQPIYPCRAFVEDEVAIGKYNPGHGICYIPYYGVEYNFTKFEVLTIPGGLKREDSEYMLVKVPEGKSKGQANALDAASKDAVEAGYILQSTGQPYGKQYIAFGSVPNLKKQCRFDSSWWKGDSIGKVVNYNNDYNAYLPLCKKEFHIVGSSYYVLTCKHPVPAIHEILEDFRLIWG